MKRKKWLRIALIVLLSAVIVFCVVKIITVKLEYDTGEQIYGEALDTFVANPQGAVENGGQTPPNGGDPG